MEERQEGVPEPEEQSEIEPEQEVEEKTEEEKIKSDRTWNFFRGAIFVGLSIWFGVDGWLNTAKIEKWIELGKEFNIWWNRGGSIIFFILAAYFIIRALKCKLPDTTDSK
jgi:hypothetical protein